MTTASELVKESYRESNIIAIEQDPTTSQYTEGLARLNNVLKSAYGFLMGEFLSDWPVPSDQSTGTVDANSPLLPGSKSKPDKLNNAYPPCNTRIVWDGSTQTVYFPARPNDGARMSVVKASGAAASSTGYITIDGNGRYIEGSSTYTSDDEFTERSWLYRADLASWVALTTLELTDDCPFPAEFDDLWSCATSIRLAPRYGKQIQEGTIAAVRQLQTTLKTKYRQETPSPSGGSLLQTSDQAYSNGYYDGGWMY